MGRRSALKAYQNVEVESNAAYADGVQLVQMLFNGLMESIDKAHGHIERGEIAEKNETISRAQKIILVFRCRSIWKREEIFLGI